MPVPSSQSLGLEVPPCRAADEQRDELAPFHASASRAYDRKDSTP
jgi:hypothetical protein